MREVQVRALTILGIVALQHWQQRHRQKNEGNITMHTKDVGIEHLHDVAEIPPPSGQSEVALVDESAVDI